jgi:hypothetical protein
MRLAPSERERLWAGLEAFVNCSDSVDKYQYLSANFGSFWPAEIWHSRPKQGHADQQWSESPIPAASGLEIKDQDKRPEYERVNKTGTVRKEFEVDITYNNLEAESLNWHQACHKLFLFYRDSLRAVWSKEDAGKWPRGSREEFLLGLTQFNQEASQTCNDWKMGDLPYIRLLELFDAWKDILDQFPNAQVEGQVQIRMLWKLRDFVLLPVNDFQKAFYILFRQNWRARLCRRCKGFFIARKPKQIFCGTDCSAGNRLASKRKWWNRVGVKRRAKKRQESGHRAA